MGREAEGGQGQQQGAPSLPVTGSPAPVGPVTFCPLALLREWATKAEPQDALAWTTPGPQGAVAGSQLPSLSTDPRLWGPAVAPFPLLTQEGLRH